MRCLELFAGIGGFPLAWQRLGWEHVGFVEIDPWCRAVLEKHWPMVPQHDDIKTYSATALRGYVDLVSGGPPCQPASVAGKRRGADDERWLWPDFLRVVSECHPRWVVAENPPGLVSLQPRGLDWILSKLEEAGYETEAVVLGAHDIGAPHLRRRVWIVAHAISDNIRLQSRRSGRQGGEDPAQSRQFIRDTAGERLQGRESLSQNLDQEFASTERAGLRFPAGRDEPQRAWEPPRAKPRLGRDAPGLPRLLDSFARKNRLKALGNSVVPQCAEMIGRAIQAVENMR
ncbi:MAG: DNA cytosine methyltransferase [Salinibacterium sp.]|nr:MAG: DNA cytosine methyltransferase [Salinibacterium sp.]